MYQSYDILVAPPPTTVGDSKLSTSSLTKDSPASEFIPFDTDTAAPDLESKVGSSVATERYEAAKIIQRSWRSHIVSL